MLWLTLLQAEVDRLGSKAAAARQVGISRTAVSLALAGKYPANDTAPLEAKVLAKLAHRIPCPHDRAEIARGDCAGRANAPMPMAGASALRAWTACQSCPHRPKESKEVDHA
ncbi:MAG: LacI family transcriptional regulator [Magnetospirillum sp.]|nr:LacI family transcriptional regulator [Magnetospirillum sp.]